MIKTRKTLIFSIFICTFLSLCGCNQKTKTFDSNMYIHAETITPNGFIYSDDGVVTSYLNKDNLEITPYCSNANCIHNDSSCQARLYDGTERGPIPYGNCIYYFSKAEEEWLDNDKDGREETPIIKDSLMCYNLENDETKCVASWEGTAGCCYNGACILDDNIYFIGVRGYTEFSDLPGLETPENISMECRLYRFDLKTEKLKDYGSLYDEDLQYSGAASTRSLILRGVSDDNIYFMYSYLEDISQEDTMENEKHICIKLDPSNDNISVENEAAPELICDGYRCHTENDNAVVKKGDKTWEFPAIKGGFLNNQLTIANDSVWYINGEESWYYDLKEEQKTDFSVSEPLGESPCVIFADSTSCVIKYLENGAYSFRRVSL